MTTIVRGMKGKKAKLSKLFRERGASLNIKDVPLFVFCPSAVFESSFEGHSRFPERSTKDTGILAQDFEPRLIETHQKELMRYHIL